MNILCEKSSTSYTYVVSAENLLWKENEGKISLVRLTAHERSLHRAGLSKCSDVV